MIIFGKDGVIREKSRNYFQLDFRSYATETVRTVKFSTLALNIDKAIPFNVAIDRIKNKYHPVML